MELLRVVVAVLTWLDFIGWLVIVAHVGVACFCWEEKCNPSSCCLREENLDLWFLRRNVSLYCQLSKLIMTVAESLIDDNCWVMGSMWVGMI